MAVRIPPDQQPPSLAVIRSIRSISFFSVITIDHQTCMHCVHLDHNQCACRSIGSACICYASTTCPRVDSHLSYSHQSQKHSFSSFILQLGHLVIFMIYLFLLHLDLVIYLSSLLSLDLDLVKSLLKINQGGISAT